MNSVPEKDVIEDVRNYFIKLGYPAECLMIGLKISSNHDVALHGIVLDMAIIINNYVKIIVEYKPVFELDAKTFANLRFNPIVRQIQTYANLVQSKYYVLANGKDFIWFSTDISGRPQPIDPIQYSDLDKQSTDTRVPLIEIFGYIMQSLKQDGGGLFNASINFVVILLAKLLSNKSELNVPNIDTRFLNDQLIQSLQIDISDTLKHLSSDTMNRCFDILNQCDLMTYTPQEMLLALDQTFFQKDMAIKFKIPRWLADFLIRLAHPKNNSFYFDISDNFGEISSAITLSGVSNNTYAICKSIEGALYAKLQQIILNGNPDNIKYHSHITLEQINHLEMGDPDYIISAFPFGSKITKRRADYYSPFKFSLLEDYLLFLSTEVIKSNGRIVTIVPESFLINTARKYFREYLQKKYSIRAIISLPIGTFAPYSNLKTSILVVDKSQNLNQDIFWGTISSTLTFKNTFNCTDIQSIKDILSLYNEYLNTGNLLNDLPNCKVLSLTELNDNISEINNLSVKPVIESQYPTVTLHTLCKSIIRGKKIKLSNDGDIFILGPAAIRPLEIDHLKFDASIKTNIGEKPVVANYGDIVINSIGTHLGSASIFDDEEGRYISQHVVLIKPDSKKVNPKFLAIALNSRYVQDYYKDSISGTVIPSLNISKIKSTPIPLPELTIQNQIVKRIEYIQQHIRTTKKELLLLEKSWQDSVDNLSIGETEL